MLRFGILLLTIFLLGTNLPLLSAQTGGQKLDQLINKLKLDTVLQSDSNQTKEEDPPKTNAGEQVIRSIRVTGNVSVSEVIIQSQVGLRVGETVNEYRIQHNARRIEGLGLFSNVDYDIVTTKDGIDLIFKVTEFPVIKAIVFPGMNQYASSNVNEKLKNRVGDIYNKRNLREDIKTIEDMYLADGLTQAKIKRVDPPTAENPTLTFYVIEGVISEIVITGNYKTQDYVIRRELSLAPGDVVTQDALNTDLRRVFNLNYFTALEPRLVPLENDEYELQIDVTERETSGQVSFGGAYSPQSGFSIFSDLFWDNVFGTGQLVLLKGQFGLGGSGSASNSRFQFKYQNPWMWDGRKSLTTRVWRTTGQAVSALSTDSGSRFRDENRLGMDFAVGLPVTYEFQYVHKVKFEQVELTSFDKNYSVGSYTFGMVHDTRDIRFNPRDGHYISFFTEQAFLISSDSLDYTRFDLTMKKFFPTLKKQTFALLGDIGYLTASDITDEQLYSSEYYRVGFADTVRGQNQNQFHFGNRKVVTTAEYRFLFTDFFSLVLFVDAGFATNNSFGLSDIPDLVKVGKGVGVRFMIPGLGPLRVDAGSDEAGVIRIQVNVGHTF